MYLYIYIYVYVKIYKITYLVINLIIHIVIYSSFDMQQYMSISPHVAIHHYLTYRCTFGSLH
jgi:hypothetical protein